MQNAFQTQTHTGIILSLTPSLQKVSYITVLTKNHGLIDIKHRIPSKLQHRNSGKLEPFTQGQFQLYTKGTIPTLQEIHQAKNTQLENITPNNLYLLSYFVKLTKQLFPKEQGIPLVYQSWIQILNNLKDLPPEKIYLYFLAQLIIQTGIMPNLKKCNNTQELLNQISYFSSKECSLTNIQLNDLDIKITLETRKLIHNLNHLDTIQKIKIPQSAYKDALNFLVNIIASYINKPPHTIMPPSELF